MTGWIDISRPVDDSLVRWPGRQPPEHSWTRRLERGDHCNASFWHLHAHTGTHMDAPLHFDPNGRPIDRIPPEVFIGPCQVVDARALAPTGSGLASAALDEAWARQYAGAPRLLIHTGHSEVARAAAYPPHPPLLTPAAVCLLLESGMVLLGTDRLSVDDSPACSYELHRLVLGAGCVILEGLQLAAVSPGAYTLYAAPLLLTGTEASPVRALLLSTNYANAP
jgi:arylformamidase